MTEKWQFQKNRGTTNLHSGNVNWNKLTQCYETQNSFHYKNLWRFNIKGCRRNNIFHSLCIHTETQGMTHPKKSHQTILIMTQVAEHDQPLTANVVNIFTLTTRNYGPLCISAAHFIHLYQNNDLLRHTTGLNSLCWRLNSSAQMISIDYLWVVERYCQTNTLSIARG